MNHTLIGNNTTYGAGATGAGAGPADLLAGAIGAFGFDVTEDNPAEAFKLVTAATIANFKDITFYRGLGNGKVLQSVTHYLSGNCIASKHVYREGTNTSIVLSGFVIPEAQDNCCHKPKPYGYLSIGEDVPNFLNYGDVYRADVSNIIPGTTTVAQLTAMIAERLTLLFAINGVSATATATATEVTIEFSDSKKYFVAASGFLEGLDVEITYGDIGFGTAEEIEPKEFLDSIYRGNLYTAEAVVFNQYRVPTQAVAGTTYDAIYLQTVNVTDDKTGQKAITDTRVNTWVYAPVGSALQTALEAIVDALDARTYGTAANVEEVVPDAEEEPPVGG